MQLAAIGVQRGQYKHWYCRFSLSRAKWMLCKRWKKIETVDFIMFLHNKNYINLETALRNFY